MLCTRPNLHHFTVWNSTHQREKTEKANQFQTRNIPDMVGTNVKSLCKDDSTEEKKPKPFLKTHACENSATTKWITKGSAAEEEFAPSGARKFRTTRVSLAAKGSKPCRESHVPQDSTLVKRTVRHCLLLQIKLPFHFSKPLLRKQCNRT